MTGRGRDWIPGERLAHRPDTGEEDAPAAGSGGPRIGVVALQGDVLEHLRALARCGAEAVRVRRPADLEGLDGVIVPGGESTTIGRLLERSGLLQALRARIREGLPTFGTCAGLILLSDELDQDFEQPLIGGLSVRTRRNAFGRQVDSFDTRVRVEGIDDGPLEVSFIRAPWVEEILGEDVEVLAEVEGHPVVVLQGEILAAAFHPEVTGDDRLHRWFVERCAGRGGGSHLSSMV